VWRTGAKLLTIVAMLFASSIAHAENPPTPPSQPWLLGDWGGVRTRLYEKGIDFQLGHVSETAYNALGGTKALVDYTDQVTGGVTLDLEKLITLPSSSLQITYTERAGRNLVQDANLNTLQLVQEVYGRGQTVRVTQFFLDHSLLNGLIKWRWGRMAVGDDFADFPCQFQNLTFCGSPPGNLVGNYIFNWPISQWGTRVRLMLDGFGYAQMGVYDQNQQYLGFQNKLWPVWYSGSTGVLLPFEVAWLPTFGSGQLPGSYKIGAWYSTSKLNDVVLDVNGTYAAVTGLPPKQHKGLYGAYLTFQQQVTRNASVDPNGGWNLFLNAVVSDAATSATNFQMAAGFIYTGPFSWRPHDFIGFAAGMTHVNTSLTQVQNLQNSLNLGPVVVQYPEHVLELFYTIQPTPGLHIRPNVQYVFTPGASNEHRNIIILGLKTVVRF
jgi:porin